jgi:hypothetical protein
MALRTSQMLTRWKAFAPGTRMPDSIEELDYAHQMALGEADPELFALLANQATAELELAAISGELAAAAPTAQERADAAKAARIAELVDAQVFGVPGRYEGDQFIAGKPSNLTGMLELQALDPELAAKLQAQAQPPVHQPGTLTAEGAAFVNGEVLRQRMAAYQSTPTGA